MEKSRKPKREHDFAVNAFRIAQQATGLVASQPSVKHPRNFDAKALGHLGGLKGGKARAEKLTPEQRTDIARNAAKGRWGKDKVA